MEIVKINTVKTNSNNPRIIKDDKFKKLVKSIKDFPEMLKLRPIVVNDEMIVLGGNMRLKACKEAGLTEIPIIKASDLTEEQQREFIIKDNVGFGEWDWDIISNEWDAEQVAEWGLDLPNTKEEIKNEVEFSEYIGEENNYVVLLFDNDMDWLSAETHFDIKTVTSKRANGKAWSKGVGRVLNGADYLDKLRNENI
jgi:hypothetical protein